MIMLYNQKFQVWLDQLKLSWVKLLELKKKKGIQFSEFYYFF